MSGTHVLGIGGIWVTGNFVAGNNQRLPYTGSISLVGNQLSNGSTTGLLIGVNLSGLENSCAQGGQPWADSGWHSGSPDWTYISTWKPNCVRIPLNAASWLGLTTYDTTGAQGSPAWGSSRNCDPFGNYKAAVATAIAGARSIGCYIIFDLHWCNPQITLGGVTHYLSPLGQSPFADNDTGYPFWCDGTNGLVAWLIANYGASGFKDMMFELYNEPYLNANGGTLSAGSADLALINGGTGTEVINSSQGGTNYSITATWNARRI